MVITESTTIRPDRYIFPGGDSLNHPVLTIRGDNITVDFQGTQLIGAADTIAPDAYAGLALRIGPGRNITIRNLKARGYRVALLAENVDSLHIEACDFSYNYRQRLYSTRRRENIADWLNYQHNDQDEWLHDGAAIYLKNCRQALVREVHITGGQNGLLLTGCDDGLFYNNTIQFNSGVGIGLYRSNRNRVLHNRLDWNVRGYSHGIYARGQDSAGILCYEQSSQNVFAYNSATHCGDGFFLWAGQQTIETGEGGCNGNIVFGNDFSFAPANGIEATFSRNDLVGNRMQGCRYGIWAGYSYHTRMIGNTLLGNQFGIAVEHGNNNAIIANAFIDNKTGIQLWERQQQPLDWLFLQHRNVASRHYQIEANVFRGTDLPLDISNTRGVNVSGNTFVRFNRLLTSRTPTDSLLMAGNVMDLTMGWGDAVPFLAENVVRQDTGTLPPLNSLYDLTPVQPLADGHDTRLPDNSLKGRSFILMGEWGPYNFMYPSVWLREADADRYVFLLLGPQGNWKLTGGEGAVQVNPKTGSFPATVTVRRDQDVRDLSLQFEFIGEQVITERGDTLRRGTPVPFSFSEFNFSPTWWVRFYEFDSTTSAQGSYPVFQTLRERKAGFEMETDSLAFVWWDSPGGGINPDRFATFAETTFDVPPGDYRLILTSDDGARLYLDNRLLIDHWEAHSPEVDVREVKLSGRHTLKVEHYEIGGLATLELQIEPLRQR